MWLSNQYESRRDPDTQLLPLRLSAPEAFNINHPDPRREFLRFLKKLRDTVQQEHRIVYIDFSGTYKMSSDATLLLYAELILLNGTAGKKMVRCAKIKTNKLSRIRTGDVIWQVLQHIGIFNVLGKRANTRIIHHSVKHWNSASGIEVEGEKLKSTVDFYKGNIAPGTSFKGLYPSLIEAMTNSVQHAYAEEEDEKWWWIFSEERDDVLTVAMYDRGIGIPASLRKGKWPEIIIKNALSKFGIGESHGSLILAAFEVGKSRTGHEFRGKGLQQVRDVLDTIGRGSLRIHSGHGFYEYEPNQQGKKPRNFDCDVQGTLITWKLPIPREAEPSQLALEELERGTG